MRLLKYSNASTAEIKRIKSTLNSSLSNLQPSQIYMWLDDNHSSEYIIVSNVLVARVRSDNEYIWSMSANNAIDLSQFGAVIQAIRTIDVKTDHLRFIPEIVANKILNSKSYDTKQEDSGNFDYIYDVKQQTNCLGSKFQDTRRHIKKFEAVYGDKISHEVYSSQFDENINFDEVKELFDDWLHFGTEGSKDSTNEQQALSIFFDKKNTNIFGDLIIILLRHNKKLVGFSASELLSPSMAINHFQKANLNLSSISHYMFHNLSQTLGNLNVEFINFQEDCGIAGLKAFKKKLRPLKIEKLYSIKIV
jgi:hypothetical protein